MRLNHVFTYMFSSYYNYFFHQWQPKVKMLQTTKVNLIYPSSEIVVSPLRAAKKYTNAKKARINKTRISLFNIK